MITKRWQICWPPVSDTADIQRTVWMGCFAAFFYAGNWGLILFFGVGYGIITTNLEALGKSVEALIPLTIATSIGWGIYKKIKAAPVAGFILAVYGFIGNWITKGFIHRNSIIMIIFAWMFLQSARGIFAYHKIDKDT